MNSNVNRIRRPFSAGEEMERDKLRGTLINKQRQKEQLLANRFSGKVFLNRDSGEEYRVRHFDEHSNKVTLVSSDEGKTVTLDLASFEQKIQTEGGAWRVKRDAKNK